MPGGGVVHAPVSWIRQFVDLPTDLSARALADAFVRVGLEVERIQSGADAISGPVVVGRVISADPEPQKNGRTINWCSVDVGGGEPRGIVCGAHNFGPGDLVVVALPGAELPGGFAIAARKTYGHVSDGMICSARELGTGTDHAGILVLPPASAEPGDDALRALGLDETTLEIAVTPDRGYCLSMRGLAREASIALDAPFRDIADSVVIPTVDSDGHPVTVQDPAGCDRFSMRAVDGLDPAAPSPDWMRRRLQAAGMRPISLAVDVTNYVMLETGQPLHAFDRDRVRGAVGVRRARPGEQLVTLDGVTRTLHEQDLVVTDDSGPVALAGVMGGAGTEIGPATTRVLLEAAHWDPSAIARAVRRHKLPSEAAKRFERGVDPAVAAVALQRCVDLLVEHGGARPAPGFTVVGDGPAAVRIRMAADHPSRLSGLEVSAPDVVRRLEQVGCAVRDDDGLLTVTPPSWRPDLTDRAGLVEEVVRLQGYDRIPSTLPTPPPGTGLTARQLLRRAASRALAAAGHVEVTCPPFVGAEVFDAFGLAADDPRRVATVLANPLSDAQPLMRTTLLPGLLEALARNRGRGMTDLALFQTDLVYLPVPGAPAAPVPGVDRAPGADELAALDAAVPHQPWHAATVRCGAAEPAGWAGPGRAADWTDAVAAAHAVAAAARAGLEVRAAEHPPWHPGRCAELRVDGRVVGHAGELAPRVLVALGLPERTVAMELDLDALEPPLPARAPLLSTFPPVLLDLALVVPVERPAADVLDAVRAGAGALLESARLFDVYRGEQVGEQEKSLAFALRFRAPDRTLTVAEATEARDRAVARAADQVGARLRR